MATRQKPYFFQLHPNHIMNKEEERQCKASFTQRLTNPCCPVYSNPANNGENLAWWDSRPSAVERMLIYSRII